MKDIRTGFSSAQKLQYNSQITKRVLSLREYKSSGILFIYISKDIEVNTEQIIKAAFADGKSVAVPKCIPEQREMDFYIIEDFSQLESGFYGLMEPVPEKCERVTDFSEGLCIVPGLGFDRSGYRLGFGMGYYDRFLPRFGGDTAGICYSQCICAQLPHGYYDKRVSVIVTEEYIKNIRISDRVNGRVLRG